MIQPGGGQIPDTYEEIQSLKNEIETLKSSILTLQEKVNIDDHDDRLVIVGNYGSSWPLTTVWKNMGGNIVTGKADSDYFKVITGNNLSVQVKKKGLYFVSMYEPSFQEGSSSDGSQVGWMGIMKNDQVFIQDSIYCYWTSANISFNPELSAVISLEEGDTLKGVLSRSGLGYNLYGGQNAKLRVIYLY